MAQPIINTDSDNIRGGGTLETEGSSAGDYRWQQQVVQVADIGLEVARPPDLAKANLAFASVCGHLL
jgi:hypothetical protein